MNSQIQALYPKIVEIIDEYGVTVTIYRDIYENEVGVKTLKEQMHPVYVVKAVIDNSKSVSTINNNYKVSGVLKPQNSATIYIAYDENLKLQPNDYILIDGIRYTFDMTQDLLHYHLLYQFNVEVNIDE